MKSPTASPQFSAPKEKVGGRSELRRSAAPPMVRSSSFITLSWVQLTLATERARVDEHPRREWAFTQHTSLWLAERLSLMSSRPDSFPSALGWEWLINQTALLPPPPPWGSLSVGDDTWCTSLQYPLLVTLHPEEIWFRVNLSVNSVHSLAC